jgi:DNA-binding transcriptional LysR family regulator
MHSGVLPEALRSLRAGRPAVHIALYNQQSVEQLEGLRQRRLDIALVCAPPPPQDPDLQATQVLSDPMLLAVPEDHPLAHAKRFTPADLAAHKWIGVMDQEGVLQHDTVIAASAKAGFTSDMALQASEPLAAMGLVAAGMSMVQQSLRHQVPRGVVLHELPWFNCCTTLWVAWHRINSRPLVEIFRQTLEGAGADKA